MKFLFVSITAFLVIGSQAQSGDFHQKGVLCLQLSTSPDVCTSQKEQSSLSREQWKEDPSDENRQKMMTDGEAKADCLLSFQNYCIDIIQ